MYIEQPEEYVAIDIETTGLQPKSDYILEIGAVRIKSGEVQDTYSVFLKHDIQIPKFITELTGITKEMVQDGVSEETAIREVISFCENLPLLGHNILFDYRFLKKSAVFHNLTFEKYGIDTLEIARQFLPKEMKKDLHTLCQYYEIRQEHCHRAYDDAMAAGQLFELLKKDYYVKESKCFQAKPLIFRVKKESFITNSQKGYLNDLIKYHRIRVDVSIDDMTKNEASRFIDEIILKYGKIKR